MSNSLKTLLSNLNTQTVFVGLVVVLIVYKVIWRLKYKLPPGPFALPLIGNYQIFLAKSGLGHEMFAEYTIKYGPVFQIYLGPIRLVVLNNIKVVTEALIERKADFANRPQNALTKLMSKGGKNIVFANYTPTWKLRRKIAGKAMSTNYDDPELQRIIELDKELKELIGTGLLEDFFPILIKIKPTRKYLRMKELFEEGNVILTRKFQQHQDTYDPENMRDIADALIHARDEAEDEEHEHSQLSDLIPVIFDIFFAGIDTTKMTLCFVLRYMAGLTDIQCKVQEELDRVVGTDRYPGLKDRENLSYGEATLHEIMRLGSVAPVGVPHSTNCDTKVGGYDIPKGTMVIVNHWGLHHDPNYCSNVDEFDPTRYLDDKGKLGLKPESWLPFSMGRRVCLGEVVAKPELHLLFSCIFQRFQISLAEGSDPEIKFKGSPAMLQPADFKIVVKERK